jgi:hypothetical protein
MFDRWRYDTLLMHVSRCKFAYAGEGTERMSAAVKGCMSLLKLLKMLVQMLHICPSKLIIDWQQYVNRNDMGRLRVRDGPAFSTGWPCWHYNTLPVVQLVDLDNATEVGRSYLPDCSCSETAALSLG